MTNISLFFISMVNQLTDPKCMILVFVAVTCGIIVGALPGLTATMGVALMVPFTYSMDMITSY